MLVVYEGNHHDPLIRPDVKALVVAVGDGIGG